MAKTEEELTELRKDIEDIGSELDTLSDEELDEVLGGTGSIMTAMPGPGDRKSLLYEALGLIKIHLKN